MSRVEELTLRTSQMNATGVHYSDATLRDLLADPDHDVLTVTMADRFGPPGGGRCHPAGVPPCGVAPEAARHFMPGGVVRGRNRDGVLCLHLPADRREGPTTMRLTSPDLAAGHVLAW